MVEILKQGQYVPMSVEHQVAIIYAGTQGMLDDVAVVDLKDWETDFHTFMDEKHAGVLTEIRTSGKLADDTVANLKAAIEEFKASR
jgi:F-type H+-transporting ATPase subunit alpha